MELGILVKHKQIAVIGLGQFGIGVTRELIRSGHDVLVIDRDERLVNDFSSIVTHTMVGDATDDELLSSLGLRNFDYVIVAIGEDIQASILITLLLKDMDIEQVWVKATNRNHHKILDKIGADMIIHPEKDIGKRLAQQIINDNLLDFIEISDKYSITEIVATNKVNDKTLHDLDMNAKYGITLVAIKERGGMNITPEPDLQLEKDDVLVVIGSNADIMRFKKAEL